MAKQHEFSPKGQQGWCKFWRQDGTYDDNKRLPSAFLVELRPIFTRLADGSLLQRCMQGLTQNQNESINRLLWSLCPKTKFCGRKRVEVAVCNAVCHFNQGATSRCSFLSSSGVTPAIHMIVSTLKMDNQRIKNAQAKITAKYRASRRKRRADKKSKQKETQTLYYPGGFGLSSTPELITIIPKKASKTKANSKQIRQPKEANKEENKGKKKDNRVTEENNE